MAETYIGSSISSMLFGMHGAARAMAGRQQCIMPALLLYYASVGRDTCLYNTLKLKTFPLSPLSSL